jgi:hypothetical protein
MNRGSKGVEGKPGDESSSRKVPVATQSKVSAARTGEQQGAMQRKGKAKTESAARKRRTPFVL